MSYDVQKGGNMKRLIFFAIVLMSLHTQAKHQKLSLQKALELKAVKAQAQSMGGYQDYCMNMNLKNLTGDSLIVLVEVGRRLNSLDEKDQDILVTKEEIIVLKKAEDKWFLVKGFCCQATNHSPKKNAKYDVNKLADSNLVTLARYMSTRTFETNVVQNAIWAISDKNPTSQVTGKNDSLFVGLRELVAGIKGEPLPWYTVISSTYVFQSGAMEVSPILLRGKLNYTNDKDCYTTLHVLNSKGIEVCQIIKQWATPGTKDYDLNIPVKGLAKGKYTIELNTPDKNLVKKEFEI